MLTFGSVNFVVALGGEASGDRYTEDGRAVACRSGVRADEIPRQTRGAVWLVKALMIRSLFFFIRMMRQSNDCRAARRKRAQDEHDGTV